MGSPAAYEAIQRIADQLCEGVSKFTLFVVKKKEARAAIPPNLTQAVSVVTNQCNTMVDLSHALAESFSDFPTIEAEIKSEAVGLESSGKNLLSTVQSMSGQENTDEVQQSWHIMSTACAAIAEAAIRLLEIIFESELKRIYLQAEKSKKAMAKSQAFTQAQIAGDDYEKFAEAASIASSEANQLAEFVRAKAESEESPVVKQQLAQLATELSSASHQLIDAANARIEHPEAEDKKKTFEQLEAEVERVTTEVVRKIREQEEYRNQHKIQFKPTPMPVSVATHAVHPHLQRQDSPMVNVGAREVSSPKRGMKPARGRGGPMRGKPGPVPSPVSPTVHAPSPKKGVPADSVISKSWKPDNMQQIADAMTDFASQSQGKGILGCSGELAIEIEKLADAARRGAGAELLNAARNISAITDRFSTQVKDSATGTSNVKYQHVLCENSKILRDMCRQLRILASVKSTTIDSDNHMDRDEQLVSLTTNLVRMWKETGDTLEVAKLLH